MTLPDDLAETVDNYLRSGSSAYAYGRSANRATGVPAGTRVSTGASAFEN
jgi:hypothetical protein